ncbi:quinone-dependent dihydroorotate dehydrogenase [Microbacterium sp. EYE_5]|uniref:quinone-dependent dihydroorotate dehydrogenase n=1 Tax=unclassified Microbacterium TaxID=2609290 RepID=UPI002004F735|nr:MULTISPECIES: quinone-dependent dihydroorotate dehydrogenase [unclassified Microbacterium]MCK6080463.1 quinone-dependent dihydroorotate dehydrogenase [Microbacterium sp. EYE_382]MCK6085734.1 quinone-dependent dihydroorotate dehydrogenase [Microbacterium sp. EYE_384]MCK6124768.1 quinone-dependent dihydroorotate dehydrogenase [Microbacterium sp. EYE_80]MCK6127677.1 quinone-dependent dihydroorotate dehydrogenase [Microbacterium sp. EYE_79]MCK6141418.1 quinone-dependent dihydroorotate dehydroge
MYRLLFDLVLRRTDPEVAHHLGMAVIRAAGTPPLSLLARALTKPAPSLRTQALGLTFDSPFGIAAGFDKNALGAIGLYALGFGHIEVGTVTAIAQDGNPKPRLFRLPADRALINRMGFNNDGAEVVAARLARMRRRRRRPVLGANIGKSRVVDVADATADYVASTRLVAPVADYLVVNVSSPNTPGLRGLQAVETLRPLLTAVKDAAGTTPLLVKIAPDLTDDEIDGISALAVDTGLDGIVATNTTIARTGLTTDAARVEAMGAGGLSGAPLRERSLEVLRRVRAAVPADFCVIAAGGVETAADVRERLAAGADLVQGYSAFIYRGPLWGRQINRGLAR